MKMIQTVILCLLSAAALSQTMPEADDDSFICGGKSLIIYEDGSIGFAAGNKDLGRMYHYFAIENRKTGQKHYFNVMQKTYFNQEKSSGMVKAGNKFTHKLTAKVDGCEWDIYEQEVSLQSNGLIRLTGKFTPPPVDYLEVKHHFFIWKITAGILDGSVITANGQRLDIPRQPEKKSTRLMEVRGKELNCSIFDGDSEKNIKISGKTPELRFLQVWQASNGEYFNLWLGDMRSPVQGFDFDIH